MIKGFIFDLDGVIVDTADLHFKAWKQLAHSLDIKLDNSLNESLKGISRMDSLNIILNQPHVTSKFSENKKQELTEIKNTIYKESLASLSPADILPGVKVFLDHAKEKNVSCAIASASLNAPLIIKQIGLVDYFSNIVDPSTLANGKPDPEIFLKATDLLDLTTKEVVGFEDAKAGIEALNKAGIYSVGITDNTSSLKEANKIVSSFNELIVDELLHV